MRRLAELLEQPVRVVAHGPKTFVWHTSMRLAPEDRDRSLSDATWGHMAREMLATAGLARHGDTGGLRFVVVRHNDDHVHIVATLVREDGRIEWARNDYRRVVAATIEVARRFGLQRMVPPADRTAARRPSPGETHQTCRHGRARPVREELRIRVRASAAASGTEDEFFARLRGVGVLVKLRESSRDSAEITGYAVALPSEDGQTPVYFGGGKLAPDLTLPKLRARWAAPSSGDKRRTGRPFSSRADALGAEASAGAAERVAAMRHAAVAARLAAEQMRIAATRGDAATAQATAEAAADALHIVAVTIEGGQRGPLSRAADMFDRGARAGIGHTPALATTGSHRLRSTARMLAASGRGTGARETYLLLRLLLDLAALAETLSRIRIAQQRVHQAQAAIRAAVALRTAAAGTVPTQGTAVTWSTPRFDQVQREQHLAQGR